MEETYKIDPTVQYDVVPLPSQGIYYKSGKKSVRVAYLTAADENILSSPNLLQNDTVIDELLKRKILDREIKVEEYVNEDRQAILIFLRNTAFGSEYTLKLTDPSTGKEFETTLDLSVLKVKELTLVPDANGEYDYFMPISKKKIKFKFLDNIQEKELEKIQKDNSTNIAPTNTKRLEMMIKSVEGIREMMDIYHFVQNLPIKDSQTFKKFVRENKPGIDLVIYVTAPSGENVPVLVDFGVEFFRPFYGV
jgi:hypothetical protein